VVNAASPQRQIYPAHGAARLPVVVAVTLVGFFIQVLLAYLLPLYFPARGMPRDAWETYGFYSILAWIAGSPLAGALGNHLGERITWALGLVIFIFGVLLAYLLHGDSTLAGAGLIAAASLLGIASALIWIGSISLTQVVPERQRGLANSLMMASMGFGGTFAPLAGGLSVAAGSRRWGTEGAERFSLPLLLIVVLAGLCAILLWGWGQQASHGTEAVVETRGISWLEALSIARAPVFLWIILPLSLLSSTLFQATNIYLPYRAGEGHIGLIRGADDHGWNMLLMVGNFMQLIGGLLVGLLAGRRLSIRIAALILAAFAAFGLGIGLAPSAWSLFIACALFEMTRQFVRWLQTGYVSELVPARVRSTAIGLSVMLSGLGAMLFTFVMRRVQSPNSPDFLPWLPFVVAASIGAVGVTWLLVVKKPEKE